MEYLNHISSVRVRKYGLHRDPKWPIRRNCKDLYPGLVFTSTIKPRHSEVRIRPGFIALFRHSAPSWNSLIENLRCLPLNRVSRSYEFDPTIPLWIARVCLELSAFAGIQKRKMDENVSISETLFIFCL